MKYKSKKATEIELISLLEKIVGEPWTKDLSQNEQRYLGLLREYKEIGGDYDLFCEKYIRIINTKEITEVEKRKNE